MSLDHNYTKALIIGVSEFPEDTSINGIPNVLANVELLKSSLINPDIIGIPESNITVSINEDKGQIERKLLGLVNATRDKRSTLLIYYSGHGILSSNDYKLYLTTHRTSRAYLEIDGVNIEIFKNYIKRSRADRKIVILDCCHSGAFIEQSMGSMASKIQADINEFTGTYIMTSAADDEPSLFPIKSPEEPTYFTGKLIQVLNEGLDIDQQFCSLRDIYDKIEDDFKDIGLPHPQQSNVNDADQLLFAVNKKFREKKPEDELAWEEACDENTKWAYLKFKTLYPLSTFIKQAKLKIFELEQEEHWEDAINRGTLFAFTDYLDKYGDNKHMEEANKKIAELKQSEAILEEKRFWHRIARKDDIAAFQSYLARYPDGIYFQQCKEEITKRQQLEAEKRDEEAERTITLKKEQDQEDQRKEALRKTEEEVQVLIVEEQRKSQLELEAVKKREREMAAYMKKEKELEIKRLETQRKREADLEAERVHDRERQEAERLENQRKKEAQRAAINAETKLREEQAAQARKLKQQSQIKPEPESAKEFIIKEEPYTKTSVGYSKELIILVVVIVILISIFLYIIFTNL